MYTMYIIFTKTLQRIKVNYNICFSIIGMAAKGNNFIGNTTEDTNFRNNNNTPNT